MHSSCAGVPGLCLRSPPTAYIAQLWPGQLTCSGTHRRLLRMHQLKASRQGGEPTLGRSRREVTLSSLALLSLPDLVRHEGQLWLDELDFYRRRARAFVETKQSQAPSPEPGPLLDEQLALALLTLPLQVLDTSTDPVFMQWSRQRYNDETHKLRAREQRAFRSAGACGGCGSADPGGDLRPANLRDRDWVDFLSYVQFKAIAQQLQPTRPDDRSAEAVSRLQARLGQALLRVVAQLACPAQRAALQSNSSDLDDIRAGVCAVLDCFQSAGFMTATALLQCGISDDDFENHEVWASGEPAFLKYWLKQPVTLRSGRALLQEHGFDQAFIACTLRAFLAQSGVEAFRWQEFRGYPDTAIVLQQCTLRRMQPVQGVTTALRQPYKLFEPDPGGQCY
ncbi:hypothetical protein WJX72_007250 [[Myrmecia] bisecta]|uniref:Uncharacterized protein n=1 Tax=[Myrmecia] bisecta TaxID=41462 RepID=A0AAW1QAT7_9CHLO